MSMAAAYFSLLSWRGAAQQQQLFFSSRQRLNFWKFFVYFYRKNL
jgi:hypothetical protein